MVERNHPYLILISGKLGYAMKLPTVWNWVSLREQIRYITVTIGTSIP